jgi:hypothetical protein
MHSALDIVRAAIPKADMDLTRLILWERTSFPCGRVTARELYRAASRFDRAARHGRVLCDFCDRIPMDGKRLCARCDQALRIAVEEEES